MDDTIEKLVELMAKANEHRDEICVGHGCGRCAYEPYDECGNQIKAEYLIAHGVTLDNQVSSIKCDYCQEDADGYRKMLGAFCITNPFHGRTWQIVTAHSKPSQIFFCPMCGRKLAEPPKGE